MEVGFAEPSLDSCSPFMMALRQTLAVQVEVFSIVRVGAEPSFNILGVLGVKLFLNEAARVFWLHKLALHAKKSQLIAVQISKVCAIETASPWTRRPFIGTAQGQCLCAYFT